MASSLGDRAILSVAVFQAEEGSAAMTVCATGDPSARGKNAGSRDDAL